MDIEKEDLVWTKSSLFWKRRAGALSEPETFRKVHPSIWQERDSLGLQKLPLYPRAAEDIDGTERPVPIKDSVAGQSGRSAGHGLTGDPGGTGPTGQKGQAAVRGHPAIGDAADRFINGG